MKAPLARDAEQSELNGSRPRFRSIRTLLEPSDGELRRKESLKLKSLRTASIDSDPSIVELPDRCIAVSYNGFSVGSPANRGEEGEQRLQQNASGMGLGSDKGSNGAGPEITVERCESARTSADDSCDAVEVADELSLEGLAATPRGFPLDPQFDSPFSPV